MCPTVIVKLYRVGIFIQQGATLSKNNQNFRDIKLNVEENEILHEMFLVVSCFPPYISCYIAENQFPLGQCTVPERWAYEGKLGTASVAEGRS